MAYHKPYNAAKKDREAARDAKRQEKVERRAARRFEKVYGQVSTELPTAGMPDDPLYSVEELDRP